MVENIKNDSSIRTGFTEGSSVLQRPYETTTSSSSELLIFALVGKVAY